MKSITLNFELVYYNQKFEVTFESESKERNLLMEVKYHDFCLDCSELPKTQPQIYKAIKSAMKNNADSYWADIEELPSTFDERLHDEIEVELIRGKSLFDNIADLTRQHAKTNYGINL